MVNDCMIMGRVMRSPDEGPQRRAGSKLGEGSRRSDGDLLEGVVQKTDQGSHHPNLCKRKPVFLALSAQVPVQ